MNNKENLISKYENDWKNNPRWKGVKRPYSAEEVVNLKGSVNIKYSIAKLGAEKFWDLLHKDYPESGDYSRILQGEVFLYPQITLRTDIA